MRRSRSISAAVCIALSFLWAAVPAIAADTASSDYYSILRRARDGHVEEALADLKRFVESNPDDSLADDALLEIGLLYERELRDFENAVLYYEKLIDTHPNSKAARRARPRLAKLREERAGGDEPLRLYRRILHDYGETGPEKALDAMRALVEEYPGFVKRDEATHWIGDQYRRMSRYDEAEFWLERVVVEYPGRKTAFYAVKALGDIAIEERDFALARSWYEKLSDYAPVYRYAELEERRNLEAVDRFELLRRLFYAALAISFAGLSWLAMRVSWSNAVKDRFGGWRKNWDLIAYVYLAGILAILLFWRSPVYAHCLPVLIVSTAAILFLNRLALESKSLTTAQKTKHFFVILLLILAVEYAVFYAYDLVNITWDTLRMNLGA